jgi:uncharacterized Tic20 family protein
MVEADSTEPQPEDPREPAEKPAPKKKAAKRTTRKTAAKQEPEPATEEPKEPGGGPQEEAEEVPAEPFDSSRDEGPTVDMPPPGSKGTAGATGSAALAATAHLLGLADFTISIFLIGVLAPLVLWLVLKDTDPEIDHHGKESINFQLNILFWWLIAFVLSFCLIGIPILIVLPIVELVLVIVAAVAAVQGQRYEYPAIYRILR